MYHWLYRDSVMRSSLSAFARYRRAMETAIDLRYRFNQSDPRSAQRPRSSFARPPTAKNSSVTSPSSRQLQGKVGGLAPAGLFLLRLRDCATGPCRDRRIDATPFMSQAKSGGA